MVFRFQNGILLCSLILIFLLSMVRVSHAVLSMNEVQYLFEQEKGQPWKDAASEEQKAFIRDVQGREEFQKSQFKEKKEESDEGSGVVDRPTIFENRKHKVPYEVRSSFEAETGIEWKDATEENQKKYWRKYNLEEKRQKQEEALYSKKQERLEQKRKREFQMKKEKMKREKGLRDREEKLRRAKIRKKRETDKKEAEKKKRKWEAFRRGMEKKHK